MADGARRDVRALSSPTSARTSSGSSRRAARRRAAARRCTRASACATPCTTPASAASSSTRAARTVASGCSACWTAPTSGSRRPGPVARGARPRRRARPRPEPRPGRALDHRLRPDRALPRLGRDRLDAARDGRRAQPVRPARPRAARPARRDGAAGHGRCRRRGRPRGVLEPPRVRPRRHHRLLAVRGDGPGDRSGDGDRGHGPGRRLRGDARTGPAPGPYPIFRCRDGHVRIVLLAPRQWHAMRAWLGEPEDLQDPELETIAGRARASGRLHTAFERPLPRSRQARADARRPGARRADRAGADDRRRARGRALPRPRRDRSQRARARDRRRRADGLRRDRRPAGARRSPGARPRRARRRGVRRALPRAAPGRCPTVAAPGDRSRGCACSTSG